jgi:8-oxo-dGTP pyrophosphatase MutT (NUDIX family)
MSYVEFIRGKYEVSNTDYVRILISNMTVSEQHSICNQSFETLWTKLWGAGRDNFGAEFDIALDKYNRLDRQKIVAEVPSVYSDPEWGFPKGRRMRGETDMDCAVREFFEETNIPREAYGICEDMTFTEVFKGTNDVLYKHVYFIGLLHNSRLINLKQKLTQTQRREISAVEWKTLGECKKVIRPHYTERKTLLSDVERVIARYESLSSNK